MAVPVSMINLVLLYTENIFSNLASVSGMICHLKFPDVGIPEFSA
jgi:hypothetical protein